MSVYNSHSSSRKLMVYMYEFQYIYTVYYTVYRIDGRILHTSYFKRKTNLQIKSRKFCSPFFRQQSKIKID